MSETSLLERVRGDEPRREFLMKNATATAAAGLSATGMASGQDDDGETATEQSNTLTNNWKALMWIGDFQPNAKFTFVSGVVNWAPSYGAMRGRWWGDYNTRMIRFINYGRTVPLFVSDDINVGKYDDKRGFVTDVHDDLNQPQVFQLSKNWEPFGDNANLVTVTATPVREDLEDLVLQDEDWWQNNSGNSGGGT